MVEFILIYKIVSEIMIKRELSSQNSMNIRTIINLQEKNEHRYCGEGILKETGFSYDPMDLIRAKSMHFILSEIIIY